MNFEEFRTSLSSDTPPEGLSNLLLALWYAGRNEWDRSHDIAQEIHDANGSWVHAYLHRLEGDKANAGYWYAKAGRNLPSYSLEKEWESLVKYFI
jgi:hypothetical protein